MTNYPDKADDEWIMKFKARSISIKLVSESFNTGKHINENIRIEDLTRYTQA